MPSETIIAASTRFVLIDPGFCGEDHLLSGRLPIEGLTVKNFERRQAYMYTRNTKKITEIGKLDFILTYDQLSRFVHEPKNDIKSKDSATYIFGLPVIRFLLQTSPYIYTLQLEKRYEMYNHFYYPMLVKDRIKIDVLSTLYIALENDSENSFDFFMKFISSR